MTNYNGAGTGDRDAITITTGAAVSNVIGTGCTLTGTTYFFVASPTAVGVIGAETSLIAFHLKWAAAVAGTITVETCNFPKYLSGGNTGGIDVSDYDTTAGNWIQENPSTAIVAVTGSGNSATAMTVTAGGTNAGGCTFHLANIGTKRVRLKLVLSVGGVVRCNVSGKAGV